jgi:RNA polymerase sigma factor (sigma-70 family)
LVDAEFRDFFHEGFPRTVTWLLQAGFGLQEAEDAAAEAMTTFFVRRPVVGNPMAWVAKVAFRTASRSARRRRLGRDKAILAAQRDRRDPPQIGAGQLDEVVLDLLARLTPARRQVVALAYQGFANEEIAEILDTKPATVRSHRRHARHQLSSLVAELRAQVRGEFDEFLTQLQTEEVPRHDQ